MAIDPGALADSLGWALLHSIWQNTLIAGLAAAALRLTSRDNPQLRFAIAYLGMIVALIAFAITFIVYARPAAGAPGTGAALAMAAAPSALVEALDRATWLVSLAWMLGFALLSGRYLGALRETRRLRRDGIGPVPALWEARFRLWVERLGADAGTIIRESTRITTPLTIGALKPVVLVPAGFFLRLPAEQAEAILAHELAHICRQDYLLGLVQAMIRNIFFFHPAVFWLSRQVDAEREYACDARVVAETGDACALARGLGQVAVESRIARHSFAVAADGNGIKGRIRRLRERREAGAGGVGVPFAAIGAVFAAGAIVALGADASVGAAAGVDEPAAIRTANAPAVAHRIEISASWSRRETAAVPPAPTAPVVETGAVPPAIPVATSVAKRPAPTPPAPPARLTATAASATPLGRIIFAVASVPSAGHATSIRTLAYRPAEADSEDECEDKATDAAERAAERRERDAERRERRAERVVELREREAERRTEQFERRLERLSEEIERQAERAAERANDAIDEINDEGFVIANRHTLTISFARPDDAIAIPAGFRIVLGRPATS